MWNCWYTYSQEKLDRLWPISDWIWSAESQCRICLFFLLCPMSTPFPCILCPYFLVRVLFLQVRTFICPRPCSVFSFFLSQISHRMAMCGRSTWQEKFEGSDEINMTNYYQKKSLCTWMLDIFPIQNVFLQLTSCRWGGESIKTNRRFKGRFYPDQSLSDHQL